MAEFAGASAHEDALDQAGRFGGSKENQAVVYRTGVGAVSLEEIENVYRSGYSTFLRTASAIADGREAGRDAVHDAFVNAIRGREGFRGEGTLDAWLWRIVVRCALVRRRAERDTSDAVGEAIWTDRPADEQEHAEVRLAVAGLPERQRVMLFLRYYGDLDYESIATATGVRVGTVGAELHAAHASLRRYLKEVESCG